MLTLMIFLPLIGFFINGLVGRFLPKMFQVGWERQPFWVHLF